MYPMFRRSFAIFLSLLLLSCGGGGIQSVALDSLLVQDGDLPSGLAASQIREEDPGMAKGAPPADRVVARQFQEGGKTSGGVVVLLYEDEKRRDEAYGQIAFGFGVPKRTPELSISVETLPGIGEECTATAFHGSAGTFRMLFTDLVFRRGPAVVLIRIPGTDDLSGIRAYAKRLDTRLKTAL